MGKNLILEPILAHLAQIWSSKKKFWVSTLLVVSYCSKISSYTIEKKTNEPNLRKWQKNLISGPNFDPKIFFHGFYLYHMLHIVASYRHM